MRDDLDLLDEDQRLIAEAVRGVCAGFDDDYWAARPRARIPVGLLPQDGGGRLGRHRAPEEYGGGGRGITDAAVVLHEVARGAAMNGCSALHLTIFGLNPVAKFGNDRLKETFLPRAPVTSMSPSASPSPTPAPTPGGSPPAPSPTTRVDGGSPVARSGPPRRSSRRWCCSSRTGAPESGLKGLSLFLADLDPDYVDIRPIPKVGRNAMRRARSPTTAYRSSGGGWWARSTRASGSCCTGSTPACSSRRRPAASARSRWRAATYAKERMCSTARSAPTRRSATRFAHAHVSLCAAWMTALRGRRYDAGLECGEEANSAKYLAAEAAFHAADRAVQTLGGMGYAGEYHVERYWREARLQKIAPVTQEMTLNYIAQTVMGLPQLLTLSRGRSGGCGRR